MKRDKYVNKALTDKGLSLIIQLQREGRLDDAVTVATLIDHIESLAGSLADAVQVAGNTVGELDKIMGMLGGDDGQPKPSP
jgi:hypothetical protein